ncbi:hypothetical protein [Amnibacterium kyonggiense]|uniref:Uncharacterized protein n=1 Tax=Amnibacterium kyonggiense TaxID=595671 RepID=A0A4R7FTG3_9MICO|nr:hypothetical protein [Amnibacterium kyonggiense]TDS81106.1 hypothetical protein CLV52_1681 [Amnibacterium kyonggiense]
MGSNRRYAETLQRRRLNREAERAALVPDSLTEDERGAEVHRGSPVPVRAWVTFAGQPVRVLATAIEWTDVAIHVVWPGLGDEGRDAWVWIGAVERIEP